MTVSNRNISKYLDTNHNNRATKNDKFDLLLYINTYLLFATINNRVKT